MSDAPLIAGETRRQNLPHLCLNDGRDETEHGRTRLTLADPAAVHAKMSARAFLCRTNSEASPFGHNLARAEPLTLVRVTELATDAAPTSSERRQAGMRSFQSP